MGAYVEGRRERLRVGGVYRGGGEACKGCGGRTGQSGSTSLTLLVKSAPKTQTHLAPLACEPNAHEKTDLLGRFMCSLGFTINHLRTRLIGTLFGRNADGFTRLDKRGNADHQAGFHDRILGLVGHGGSLDFWWAVLDCEFYR